MTLHWSGVGQRQGDDGAVGCTNPHAIVADQQSRYPHQVSWGGLTLAARKRQQGLNGLGNINILEVEV